MNLDDGVSDLPKLVSFSIESANTSNNSIQDSSNRASNSQSICLKRFTLHMWTLVSCSWHFFYSWNGLSFSSLLPFTSHSSGDSFRHSNKYSSKIQTHIYWFDGVLINTFDKHIYTYTPMHGKPFGTAYTHATFKRLYYIQKQILEIGKKK